MFSDETVNNLMRTYETQMATETFSTLCPKKGNYFTLLLPPSTPMIYLLVAKLYTISESLFHPVMSLV